MVESAEDVLSELAGLRAHATPLPEKSADPIVQTATNAACRRCWSKWDTTLSTSTPCARGLAYRRTRQ
jgi:hypothetical protein